MPALSMTRANEHWRRLSAYAALHMPSYDPFRSPATDDDLDALSRAVGPRLPEDLVAMLRLHDGGTPPVLPQGAWFRSARDIVEAHRALGALAEEHFAECPATLSDDGAHVDAPFHPQWIPFATRDDFDIFLDLAPGPRGVVGQVLFPVNESSVVRVATSLDDLLSRWISLLDSDRLRFEPDYGYALPVDGRSFDALLRDR